MKCIVTDKTVILSSDPKFKSKQPNVYHNGYELHVANGTDLLKSGDIMCKAMIEASDSEVLDLFQIGVTGTPDKNMTNASSDYIKRYLNADLFRKSIFEGMRHLKRIIDDSEEITIDLSNADEYRILQGILIITDGYVNQEKNDYMDKTKDCCREKINSITESLTLNSYSEFKAAADKHKPELDSISEKFGNLFFENIYDNIGLCLHSMIFVSDLPNPSRKIKAFNSKSAYENVEITVNMIEYDKYMDSLRKARAKKV